ncbi:hypothetical protein PoB_001319000, partial [Plakobranchus ocellatus]
QPAPSTVMEAQSCHRNGPTERTPCDHKSAEASHLNVDDLEFDSMSATNHLSLDDTHA